MNITEIHYFYNKGILIDTNILILYFVGSFDIKLIEKFKRTRIFTIEDYFALIKLLEKFNQILITPNILTEVTNLLENENQNFNYKIFMNFPSKLNILNEIYVKSEKVINTKCFQMFGLSDAVIEELVRQKFLLLTTDLKLFCYLENNNLPVINFNHFKQL